DRSQSRSVPRSGPSATPALEHHRSTGPTSSSTRSTSRATAAWSVTSRATPSGAVPARAAATRSAPGPSRSATTTARAPSAANRSARARPIPRAPPVTTVTAPCRFVTAPCRFVTALPAEAGSFSSRGGLTRAQPGPGCDVACPVDIGVYRPADGANHRVLPGPGTSGPAGVAVDRGVGGVHEDDSPSGAFSLGGEDGRELAPAGIEDRPVESGLLRDRPARCLDGAPGRGRHVGHTEVFQRQRVVGVDEGARGLVVEVAPAVADLTPLLGQYPPQSLAVPGARLGALLTPLQVGECRLGRVEEPGGGDHFPVGGREEADHTHVDADCPACRRQRLGLGLHHDD